MAFVRPSLRPLAGEGGPGPLEESLRPYSSLWEFLSVAKWEDGSPRVTGSLSLFTDDGVWKACLNDREGSLVAFVSGASVAALLEALADGLEQGRLDWRRSRPAPGGKKK